MFDIYSKLELPQSSLSKDLYEELRNQRLPRRHLESKSIGLVAMRKVLITPDEFIEEFSIADVMLHDVDTKRYKGFIEAFGLLLNKDEKPMKATFLINANDIIVPSIDESVEQGFFIGTASENHLEQFLTTVLSQGK